MDDSTVFLDKACQLDQALGIVSHFGNLSGLVAQPAKSKLIFLNKGVRLQTFCGISVLQPVDTVRYLGYEVGTGDLQHRNWALRIRKLQRRLFTASTIASSVENRVMVLNSIILPAILFTAAVFEIPDWAIRDVQNMYKQFL